MAMACAVASLGACDVRTVASSLENFDESAYVAHPSSGGGRLLLRIPIPDMSAERRLPSFRSEVPPGQSGTDWIEQVSLVPAESWSRSDEYWYSWSMLHLFAIDREHLPDPVAMRPQGIESLFVVATRDPATGARDPFTRYIPPVGAETQGDHLAGTSTSMRFGFFVRAVPNDTPVVGSVVQGAPAAVAGLRRDDRIVSVDGLSLDSALATLDETRSTRHSLRVWRPSVAAIREFDIATAEVTYPSVWADTLPGGVGYVSITQFVSTSGLETDVLFRKALAEMGGLRRNATGWILDLRQNGGGTIVSSQGVAGALVGAKQPLVRVHEREYDPNYYRGVVVDTIYHSPANQPDLLPVGTIHLLQDGMTASASEILLSSLRERIRPRLVTYGARSYGKGIGQLYNPTPGGGYAAVTCMHIDPIDSARYHHKGIPPDIETGSSEALTRALADIVSGGAAGRVGDSRLFAAVARADRWNLRERRVAGQAAPLKVSPFPGGGEIW